MLGAGGAGTTTLARAVADHWSVAHADADDYFWELSHRPYVEKRPVEDRVALMTAVLPGRGAWDVDA
ncbi:hypothetical protein NPS01_41570 [Nocardioides psychrotolerans]|nr:hypothetical protein NPS01_41570 [Nocardioides psychrotolerans]